MPSSGILQQHTKYTGRYVKSYVYDAAKAYLRPETGSVSPLKLAVFARQNVLNRHRMTAHEILNNTNEMPFKTNLLI